MSIWVLIVTAIFFTVSGNLLLKMGADSSGFGSVWPLSIINYSVIGGALCFGFGLLFYIMLLKRMPLNIAQSIISVQFVFVILASSVVLGESIGWLRWCGIALVAVGLYIIGWSVPQSS